MTLYTVSTGGIIQAQDIDQVVNWLQHFMYNVSDYGAKGDGKTVTDGAITTGTPTLTSASAAFTSADVGKPITVTGAAAAGADLNTTISAYVNATTVTLATNAGTTVTGAVVSYATDDTAAIQAALNALPSCNAYDGSDNLVSGKTGVLFFPPGVYSVSSLFTLPAGTITFQGSGMSSWIPIMDLHPYDNLGGTAIVTSSAGGLISIPQDSFSAPATNFYLRDMDLRVVSPALPAGSSAPAVLNLKGWISGEIRNVNVLEVKTTSGIGKNLYRMIDCSPGSAKDTTVLQNVRGFGGTISILFAGAHIIAIGITAGFTGTANGSWSNSITIAYDLGCYYADLHVFASPYGLSLSTSSVFQPLVIYGVMFESCTHYMRPEFGGMSGTIIIEGPCWDSTPDPLTDIPANMAATTNIITKYESDVTGTNTSKHITVASSSQTAGTSPYTLPLQPYDQIAVITTVGGMTALSLDGQALFNGTFSVGQQVYVGAGHTLIATWATTAPVLKLLPQ